MSALVAEPMIEAELWISFAAMLRAYGVIAGLNSGAVPEINATERSVTLTIGRACLKVNCDPQSGMGNWLLSREQSTSQGRFVLLPEGRISVDGNTVELDLAAIDFAAALMSAAEKSTGEAL
jgi:hypothetical protein